MYSIKVAFQGETGAYSEAAALEYFHQEITTYSCHTFENVFHIVEEQVCMYGFIPIENTLAGSIHRNYDLMLKYSLHIVGEYHFRVKHCLLAVNEARLDQIQFVHSHPQALAQCEVSLKKLSVKLVPEADTAGSARLISEKGSNLSAAVASKHAAQVYGLQVLTENLEDNPLNFTRFLVLAKQEKPIVDTHHQGFKTSIVFKLPNKPGILFKALSVFALRDIDLTKIESRPIPGTPWEYLFYIDFIGNISDRVCQRALDHLKELTILLRILGSYPQHQFDFPTSHNGQPNKENDLS